MSAGSLLARVLEGLMALLERCGQSKWPDRLRQVSAKPTPVEVATAYLALVQGSAAGTFHDLQLTELNGDRVRPHQDPWLNALLRALQSSAYGAAHAVLADSSQANVSQRIAGWARAAPGTAGGSPTGLSNTIIYGVRCLSCGTRFLLTNGLDHAGAHLWRTLTVPTFLKGLSVSRLVDAAFDPDADESTVSYLRPLRAQAVELGTGVTRLPFNRVRLGRANARCLVCRANRWGALRGRVLDNPPRIAPVPSRDGPQRRQAGSL